MQAKWDRLVLLPIFFFLPRTGIFKNGRVLLYALECLYAKFYVQRIQNPKYVNSLLTGKVTRPQGKNFLCCCDLKFKDMRANMCEILL